MKLSEWMMLEGVGVQAVADGVSEHLPDGETCSVGAVEKWKRGLRTPRSRKMSALTKLTGGRVTANDFIEFTVPPSAHPALSKAS